MYFILINIIVLNFQLEKRPSHLEKCFEAVLHVFHWRPFKFT
jgi:hypothetical protein